MNEDDTVPPGGASEDDDRTVLATNPTTSAPPVHPAQPHSHAPAHEDRSVVSPLTPTQHPTTNQPPADFDDEDRTIFGALYTEPPAQTSVSAPSQAPLIPRAENHIQQTGMTMATEAQPPEPLRMLEPGTVINNMYRVERSLDQGGMGHVFRGVELGSGGLVAIKVILPEMADEKKAVDMFRREAMTLRQLQHEAIVRYLAYIPPDERLGFHALIMGFIEGIKLDSHIKASGPLPVPEICTLFIRISDGLSAAHRGGVVHRDLSPDNVMLPDSDISKAVLIDFGISRSAAIKDVTLGNEFAGKLKYVSPEQLGAYGGEVDDRSDIYSLALLIIMTATGTPVPMGSSIVEAVKMRESIPDLSALPSELQGLLYQMLQPDPKDRLRSMDDVEAILKEIANGGNPQVTMTSMPMMQPTSFAQSNTVSGLQAAPNVSMSNTTTTNFGGATTRTKFPQGPQSTDGSHLPDPEAEKSSPVMKFLIVATTFAVLGMGGVLGWSQMNRADGPIVDLDPNNGSGQIVRVPGSRATFLAETVDQACAYAPRRAKGPNAGTIETFGGSAASFANLPPAWQTAFNSSPQFIERRITDAQCAALDISHTFQGSAGASTELALDANRTSRKDVISGTLYGSLGRSDWLAIIAPNGLVFSLTKQLNDPIGDERGFVFRLPSAALGQYLLIAVSSEKPLVRTGAMKDGTKATDIFKLLQIELENGNQSSVDVGFVDLTP
jgi:serine/threonine protein kinase